MYFEEVQQYTFPLNPERNNLNIRNNENNEEDIIFDE
jgi:hypothetical protein